MDALPSLHAPSAGEQYVAAFNDGPLIGSERMVTSEIGGPNRELVIEGHRYVSAGTSHYGNGRTVFGYTHAPLMT